MSDNILSPEEESYLLCKAKLMKTSRQIMETVEQMERDLKAQNPNEPLSMTVHGIPGKELNVTVPLDRLTPERFDIVMPYFREKLVRYHKLRKTQKELEDTLHREKQPDSFDVVENKAKELKV